MKTPAFSLIIGGLAILATGCVEKTDFHGDPSTKYVVVFGSSAAPIKIRNRDRFKEALAKASWRRDISFKPPKSDDPSPDATASPIASTSVHTLTISQDKQANPESMHVTQRVGFNAGQEMDLAKLLAQIKE